MRRLWVLMWLLTQNFRTAILLFDIPTIVKDVINRILQCDNIGSPDSRSRVDRTFPVAPADAPGAPTTLSLRGFVTPSPVATTAAAGRQTERLGAPRRAALPWLRAQGAFPSNWSPRRRRRQTASPPPRRDAPLSPPRATLQVHRAPARQSVSFRAPRTTCALSPGPECETSSPPTGYLLCVCSVDRA